MKTLKLLTLFFALLVTMSGNAQSPEKKAQKFTDEITKVLELNEADSKAIYQIQLERFTEMADIQKKHADDPDAKKEATDALGKKVFNKMKSVLGQERQKKWKEYKDNK